MSHSQFKKSKIKFRPSNRGDGGAGSSSNGNSNFKKERGNRDRNRSSFSPKEGNEDFTKDAETLKMGGNVVSSKNVLEGKRIYLNELNKKDIHQLVKIAKEAGAVMGEEVTKQKVIFKILEKSITNSDVVIYATGVLEKISEGYGFIRSSAYNYLPGSDDIYVSHTQIKTYGLRTGDTISGQIRPPKSSEKYFGMLMINEVNFDSVDDVKDRVSFASLTPYYATSRLNLESKDSGENYATRMIDLFCPIGKGNVL